MARRLDYDSPVPVPVSPARGVYRRILSYSREFWPGIAAMFAYTSAGSVLVVLQPWPIKMVIDGVLVGQRLSLGPLGTIAASTPSQKFAAIAALATSYLVIVVVGVLLQALSTYVLARVALRMIHGLRGRLVSHMRQLGLRFHASTSVGDSIWRAINDARSMQEVMILGLRTWSNLVIRLTLMVGLMFLLDPWLTVVALLVVPPLLYAIKLLTGRIQDASVASREHMSRLTSFIEQTLVAIRAVQVFGRESRERERFDEISNSFIASQLRFRTWEQVLNVVTVFLTGLGTTAVLFFAARRVVSGAVSVGSLWVFIAYMQSLYNMMNDLLFTYGPFQDAVVGVGRAFQVLDEEPEIREAPDALSVDGFGRELRFESVGFAYEDGRPTLQDIDVAVSRGQTVAIVGETGSGKSTLLALIPRLYDVTSGAVTLDGTDVRRLQVTPLRNLISMVPQEPLLFSASIRENILYGRMDAGSEEVEAAARAARADVFVQKLPQGYETQVGERGVKLSVGQQQRISIARAFLKDAPILLLDEPTSALDLRTESDFLDGLADLMAGRTVFIVAHRLSTIRGADRIYVLDAGRIVEQGTHEELVGQEGRYRTLWDTQFRAAGTAPGLTRPLPSR